MRYAAEHPKDSGVPASVSKEYNDADPGGKLPETAKPASREEKAKARYAR
jgi:hypothetical protein